MCVRELWFLIHCSGQPKVSNFNIALNIKENISRLQITMQNFSQLGFCLKIIAAILLFTLILIDFSSSVTVIQTKGDLCQYFPNNIFSYVILLLSTSSDNLS